MKYSALDCIATILVIVGGINWGLVGAFDVNIVASIFGPMSMVSKIIYIIVGISAIYMAFSFGKKCKTSPG